MEWKGWMSIGWIAVRGLKDPVVVAEAENLLMRRTICTV